ncbi:MBL fold metallo-hydrolase [Methylobacterium sp. WL12]|uniref:MBL fold metallo-hydrolase n=1 Tax=Methylobacterium sp. WL12 TaxID=2603890 RepID=UPI0011CB6F00|nr:MBL fold metallo-hydrolase [Methylobacterium sp. WL12]TXM75362.1 MBL fold metallo-hydrolase [Methylobacterium sp. WL12]
MPGTPRVGIIPVTPFQQNCTLIWDAATKVGAVVDPGGDLDRIEAAIAEQGVRVEKILLTHGHIDHAGGAAELRERLGVPIEGPHEADRYLLDSLPETGANYGIDGARVVTPDRWLDEGDAVTVGPLAFDILHAPGHSPGSVVFVSRDARFALVGDVVFKGSVGRTDLPGGNHDQLIRAILEKVLPLGDDLAFIPGHGPTGTLGEERVSNPFLQG